MRRACKAAIALWLAAAPLSSACALDADLVMSDPDRVSWQLFLQIVAPAGPGNALAEFETWASNGDTFVAKPQFPLSAPSPKVLSFPALGGRPPPTGDEWKYQPPGGEEVRRNRAAFDYITTPENQFHTRAGLARAFATGREISFPKDAIEVKANWTPADRVDASRYYISAASDGRRYALVALHITTKMIPNWTWATFEQAGNAGRCDDIGCRDSFGADAPIVRPNAAPDQRYPPCSKTPALQALFEDAKVPAVFRNYCLKGSQTDYVAATGLPILLGNSVTEYGFVSTSSCMTCHARASVDAAGGSAQGYGFVLPADHSDAVCPPSGRCSPNGAPNPAWFWDRPGVPDGTLKALQTDFLFSLALHAIP